MKNLILTIDQSTTSSKVLLINDKNLILDEVTIEHQKYFPFDGYVEHDALEIYENILLCIKKIISNEKDRACSVAAISITNQRETCVVWNKKTHKPIYHAIVWQCQRTQDECERLKSLGYNQIVKEKTGLMIDSYFSATKIKWILDHCDENIEDLMFGTMDSWLIYQLTKGKSHFCDHTNASRTLLYNLKKGEWDHELCNIFEIPMSILPQIKKSDEIFGMSNIEEMLNEEVPIMGVIGDSQAALYGEGCYEQFSTKITLGTGSSIMVNTKNQCLNCDNGIVQALGWRLKDEIVYTQEAIIHCNADILNWMKDELHLFQDYDELNEIMNQECSKDLYCVPALLGLSIPYWQSGARASISGISRTTTAKHIVKAAMQGIIFQINDALLSYSKNIQLNTLHVNGGVSKNEALMQFLADISGYNVIVGKAINASARGSYLIACKALGWNLYVEEEKGNCYIPQMNINQKEALIQGWNKAIQSVLMNMN